MKKIGILSDTHGYLDERIIHYLSDRDEIWHAGDWGDASLPGRLQEIAPVRGVYGNIDGREIRAEFPESSRFLCEGLTILITHIGGYPGSYAPTVRTLLKDTPDIFICGHSHITKIMRDKTLGLLHINPGAAGRHGFHSIRTLALMEIENKKIQKMQIVELGKRTS